MINYKEKIKIEDVLITALRKKRLSYFDEIKKWRKDLIQKNQKEVFKYFKKDLDKDYIVKDIRKDSFSIYRFDPLDNNNFILLAKIIYKPPHIQKENKDKYIESFQIQTESYKGNSNWEYDRLITLGKICQKLKKYESKIVKKINYNCKKTADKIVKKQNITIYNINQKITKKSDYIQNLKYKEVLFNIKKGKTIKFKENQIECGFLPMIGFKGGIIYSLQFQFYSNYCICTFQLSESRFDKYKIDINVFPEFLDFMINIFYYKFIYE